jgi:phosphatidylinositol glycan class M
MAPRSWVERLQQRVWLLRWPGCLVLGLALRVALIVAGSFADAAAAAGAAGGVRYTDVDHAVYTEAAALVLKGHSPYERHTYRYTPLLALALVPGAAGSEAGVPLAQFWAKGLFALVDLLVAWLARRALVQRGLSGSAATARAAWPVLLNPLVANLSTRGNADALIVALVLATLVALQAGRLRAAAVLYGLSVHVKIYPIVYAPAIVLFLNEDYPQALRLAQSPSSSSVSSISSSGNISEQQRRSQGWFRRLLHDLLHPFGLKFRFFLWSFGTFVLVTLLCYAWCGDAFVHETYLFHVTRVDTRHNFSLYFLQLYLDSSAQIEAAAAGVIASGTDRLLLSLSSFLPQVVVLVVLSACCYRDLPLSLFATSLAFVAWNKVQTAQYFLWWIVPLLLVTAQSRMGWRSALGLGVLWIAAEAHWLLRGFQVEMRGDDPKAFRAMWAAGAAFFLANVTLLAAVILHHRFTPVFRRGKLVPLPDQKEDSEEALAAAAAAASALAPASPKPTHPSDASELRRRTQLASSSQPAPVPDAMAAAPVLADAAVPAAAGSSTFPFQFCRGSLCPACGASFAVGVCAATSLLGTRRATLRCSSRGGTVHSTLLQANAPVGQLGPWEEGDSRWKDGSLMAWIYTQLLRSPAAAAVAASASAATGAPASSSVFVEPALCPPLPRSTVAHLPLERSFSLTLVRGEEKTEAWALTLTVDQ